MIAGRLEGLAKEVARRVSRGQLGALVAAVALVGSAGVASARVGEWQAQDATTTIEFRQRLLADLGLEVRALETSAPSVVQHRLSASSPDAPAFRGRAVSSLGFVAPEGRFLGQLSGSLRHVGGFELSSSGGAISLADFELRPGPAPGTLVIAAGGERVFDVDHLHYFADAERDVVQIFNADVRLAAEAAARIGRPHLAGQAIGTMSLTARVADVPVVALPPSCGDFSGSVDVQLLGLNSVSEVVRAGGRVVIVPSASLKNVGTANVPWQEQFSGRFPPYDIDQQPFLVWSAFRITGGAIQQLGVSDVKHAFYTVNENCDPGSCTDPQILGVGCEDVYGETTNVLRSLLGPRSEIRPHAGVWWHCDVPAPRTPSHFDPDGDCDQDDFGDSEDDFTHGLVIEEADLMDPTASYHAYAWYVIRDDVNIFNTMGHREIVPSFAGAWSFPFRTPLTLGSPVDAWVSPAATAPDALNRVLTTAAGHVQLGVRVSDLGAGLYRYEYALMNHDFDRGIASFSVPLDAAASVSASGFRDIDRDATNDWRAVVRSNAIVWTRPTGVNPLSWGRLYNFSVEVNFPPEVAMAGLRPAETGTPSDYVVETLAPAHTLEILRHPVLDLSEPLGDHLPLEPTRDFLASLVGSSYFVIGDVAPGSPPLIFYGVPSATTLYAVKVTTGVNLTWE